METLTRAWEVLQDAYQHRWKATTIAPSSCISRHWSCIPPPKLILSAGLIITRAHRGRYRGMQARDRADPESANPYNDIGLSHRAGRSMKRFHGSNAPWSAALHRPFPALQSGRAYLGKKCTPGNALFPGSAERRGRVIRWPARRWPHSPDGQLKCDCKPSHK